MTFRLRPEILVINDKPRRTLVSWLWWNWLYKSPRT